MGKKITLNKLRINSKLIINLKEGVDLLINTKNFGEIEFEDRDKLYFEDGLLGFEDQKEYLLLNNYDTEEPVPFMWLQSIKDPELTFVVSIPFLLKPNYEVNVEDDVCKQLEITSSENVGVYSICKIEDEVKNMTVNFQSPLIINALTKQGKQIVMYDSEYSPSEKLV